MIITVQPGNLQKARDGQEFIYGIGRDRTGRILIEYEIGKTRDFKRNILIIQPGTDPLQVNHTCKAIENEIPCWHLGMIAIVIKINPPFDVEINTALESHTVVNDMTMDILGRQGDFQKLEFIEEDIESAESVEFFEAVPLPPWMERFGFPWRLRKRIKEFRDRQEKVLTAEQRARVPGARYIPSGQEVLKAVAALLYDSWEAPLLIGRKGSGKSTLAETLAAILMLPVNKIFGGIDLNLESLLGARTLVPADDVDLVTEMKLRAACTSAAGIDPEPLIQRLRGSQMRVGFEPGILLSAVERGEMLIIDEVNMLVPEVTSLLHGLLDWQKTLSVPGYGHVKAPESFRLVGCMNYGYAGTKPLNEAFQDRFRSVQVPHLPTNALAALITDQTRCNASTGAKLAEVFKKLSDGVANGDISEKVLSVRSFLRIAREDQYGYSNLKGVAMSVLTEGLFDQFERDQVKDVVDACIK